MMGKNTSHTYWAFLRTINFKYILEVGVLLLYLFFCYLMLEISLQYIPWHPDVAFLRIKQDAMSHSYYPWAFGIHVYGSIGVLLAGFTQFSKKIRRKFPQLHRWLGWLYSVLILFLAAPSGWIMGLHANGGFYAQLAFCLLASLWFYFTLMAIIKIRQGNIQSHRQYMWRSFALTLSAITLRAWKYLIVLTFQPRPMDVYRIVAWLGWVLNLVIIELYIQQQHHLKNKTRVKLKQNLSHEAN